MADKGLSFRPYWIKEKERFQKEGILPCLDYPMFNDMINGMLFKSFDETLKTDTTTNMKYNPQKNNFLKNFKLYLNEMKRDISKVYSVIEVNLYRIQQKATKYLDAVTKPEGKTLVPQIENLYNRLQLIAKFSQFNYEIYCHIIKKIGKQFNRLEINFELEAFNSMIADPVTNVFFGKLRLQETSDLLQILIERCAINWPDIAESLSELSHQLVRLDHDVGMERREMLRSALVENRDTINGLFEEKYKQITAKVRSEMEILYNSPSAPWLSGPLILMSPPEKEDPAEYALTVRPLVTPSIEQRKLITTGKPSGDDSPLELDEFDEHKAKTDEEGDQHEDAHRVRNVDRYFVDVNEGYVVHAQACYSDSAPWFVLTHTFFFMLTYYGLTPTTFECNVLLGIPRQYFGVISAMNPFIAAFSSFVYNYTTKVHYRGSYLISIACLFIGTFLYSLAFTHRQLSILFIGRCFFGYGGGRILTRKFYAREIHPDHRIKWSAMLVGFTGMSMTLGPGLSALLETIFDSKAATAMKLDNFDSMNAAEQDAVIETLTGFSVGGMRFSKVNYIPGLMMLIFLIMFFVFLFLFPDTPKKTTEELEAETKTKETSSEHKYMISVIQHMHLLPHDTQSIKIPVQTRMKRLDNYIAKLKAVTKYFTDKQTYYICLYLFIVKAIQEAIIVESPSYIVKNYGYTSVLSGLIFFLFTFFTLPVALTPLFLKKKFEDRAVLRFSSYLLIGALIIKCQFTEHLYPFGIFIAGTCLLLGFTLTVETCCTSIITKVISEKKAKSFMNAGLLSGLIDTLGRVTGSVSITVISSFADLNILNTILYPFWLLTFASTVICLIWMYSRLDTKMYVRFGQ